MREIWNNLSTREILLILIVKIIAIFVIWWVFFRPVGEQVPMDANQVSAVMLNPQLTPVTSDPAPRSATQ